MIPAKLKGMHYANTFHKELSVLLLLSPDYFILFFLLWFLNWMEWVQLLIILTEWVYKCFWGCYILEHFISKQACSLSAQVLLHVCSCNYTLHIMYTLQHGPIYKPFASDSTWMALVGVLFANVQYSLVYIEIVRTWLWTTLSYSKHTEVKYI